MSWERSERGWGELTQWVRVIFEFRREGTITWRYHEPQRERIRRRGLGVIQRERKRRKERGTMTMRLCKEITGMIVCARVHSTRIRILFFIFHNFFREFWGEKKIKKKFVYIYSNLLYFLIFIFLVLTRLSYSISFM